MSTLDPSASVASRSRLAASVRERTRQWLQGIDRVSWRRFFLALLGLGISFFLALYAAALRESGRYQAGAAVAAISLLLAAIVAVKIVPQLARRTVLQRWMVKVHYDVTREGLVYLLVIVVVVIAALNTGNNLLFIILASLLAGVLVSGIASQAVLADLELEFALPEHIFASRPILSRLKVHNGKWIFPSFSVTISGATKEPARRARRGRATAAAYQHADRPRRILDDPVYLPYVPRHASVTEIVELCFPRRGRYSQDGFEVSTRFPFSLLRKTHRIAARQEILVLPDVEPPEEFYEILPLISGELESFFKGRGHDLYAIRDYQESDSARHLDWKASAKALELKVREFTREDERRVTLVFDADWSCSGGVLTAASPHTESSGHRSDEKSAAQFEKAVNFCACLAWHFYEIDAQMRFVTQGFETPMAPAAEVVYPALEALALMEPNRSDNRPRGLSVGEGGHTAASALLSQLAAGERGFNIVLTSRPRGSIPTSLWESSYMVFADSL
ncbi:MAG TPA: DUF58 domain-containing protein [Terriglobia bacterium]|nr:DUF58 domain-containing protein [Terriglobia bacterium]